MADTIALTVQVSYIPDSASSRIAETLPPLTRTVTMTGTDFIRATQTVGTSEEDIVDGEIGNPRGYVLIKNLDATNYVEINVDTSFTVGAIRLNPGDFALFRAGGGLRAKANTASVDIQYWWWEA